MRNSDLRILVGIATAGRRETLSNMLAHVATQTRPADAIIVCPARAEDFDTDTAAALGLPVRVVVGRVGSCHQRNAILDAAGDADVVVFFDDDFLPADDYLSECERAFCMGPRVTVVTGVVLADGAQGPGLTLRQGRQVLAADAGIGRHKNPTPVHNAYGCNMAFRLSAIRKVGARFDEALPLYAWQEDVDFCRRLASQGSILQSPAMRGVHLGVKSGRTSGLRLGYSQIANPLYLANKGTVSLPWALRLMARNMAANVAGSVRKPGLVDRRGRLRGNLRAVYDLVRRRLAPDRILEFETSP
ncbi:MAG: glycosyltransferase [Pseudomonadota bacterium]